MVSTASEGSLQVGGIKMTVDMNKVGVLSLVWDEGMSPTNFLVKGVDNLELLRIVQDIEEEYEGTEVPVRDIPKMLMDKGYVVEYMSYVSCEIGDDASYFDYSTSDISVKEDMYD